MYEQFMDSVQFTFCHPLIVIAILSIDHKGERISIEIGGVPMIQGNLDYSPCTALRSYALYANLRSSNRAIRAGKCRDVYRARN